MSENYKSEIHLVEIDQSAAERRRRMNHGLLKKSIYLFIRSVWKLLFIKHYRSELSNKTKKRVLIIRPDHIGDFVLSLPSIMALKTAFNDDYTFEILINPCNTTIAQRLEIFDCIYVFKIFGDQREKYLPSFAEFSQIAKKIGEIDIAIDFRSGRSTKQLVFWIKSISKPQKVFSRDNQLTMKYESAYSFAQDIVHKLGLQIENSFNQHAQMAKNMLGVKFPAPQTFIQPLIVFCPEARHEKKVWSEQDISTLITRISDSYGSRFSLLLLGTSTNNHQFEHPCIIDIRGKTSLNEAFEFVNACKIFIGFDSGLTHLASLLGKPTISIFNGYTDPSEWSSISIENNLVLLEPKQNIQSDISEVMNVLAQLILKEIDE